MFGRRQDVVSLPTFQKSLKRENSRNILPQKFSQKGKNEQLSRNQLRITGTPTEAHLRIGYNKKMTVSKLSFSISIFVHYLRDGISCLLQRLGNLNPKLDSSFNSDRKKIVKTGQSISGKIQKFRAATTFQYQPQDVGLSFTFEVPALDVFINKIFSFG